MRIRTFTAPTIQEAMAQVRDALGPDAIIISTFEGRRGRGAEIRAAVEAPPPLPARQAAELDEIEAKLRARLERAEPAYLKRDLTEEQAPKPKSPKVPDRAALAQAARALSYHRLPGDFVKAIVTLMRRLDAETAEEALTQAFDLRLRFAPVPEIPPRPILLAGPPGSGKTATAVKIAAASVLAGAPVTLVTTDTIKSGGLSQIENLATVLEVPVQTAERPTELKEILNNAGRGCVVIDTPGTNPLNPSEVRDLKAFCQIDGIEPILVMAAGGDLAESSDMAKLFSGLGATRFIPTRMDACRRYGAVLWAAETAHLAFAQASMTPYLADGLSILTPQSLADLFMNYPRPEPRQGGDTQTEHPSTGAGQKERKAS